MQVVIVFMFDYPVLIRQVLTSVRPMDKSLFVANDVFLCLSPLIAFSF